MSVSGSPAIGAPFFAIAPGACQSSKPAALIYLVVQTSISAIYPHWAGRPRNADRPLVRRAVRSKKVSRQARSYACSLGLQSRFLHNAFLCLGDAPTSDARPDRPFTMLRSESDGFCCVAALRHCKKAMSFFQLG